MMKARVGIWIAIVVLAGGGLAYVAWQQQRPAGAIAGAGGAPDGAGPFSGPQKVVVAPVEVREFFERVEALGTLKADESIEITANVTETVDELLFDDGQLVKKDDPLAILNGAEERAMLEGAQATLKEQEREISRLQGLVKEGAVSEVRLEEYRTQRDIAEQRVREVRAQLADRRIVAPFSGQLGTRRVSPGALVRPGTVITTLDALERVKLDFTVPETFLSELGLGRTIEAHSAAYAGETFEGKVTHIDPRIDPVTRSVTVRAIVPNPDLKLRPGMLMRVLLTSGPRQSPSIPERALVTQQTRHFAFVVDDTPDGRVARRVTVEIGRRRPGYVEVRSGLEPGQTVVADGLLGLADGKAITVTGVFKGPSEAYNPLAESSETPESSRPD